MGLNEAMLSRVVQQWWSWFLFWTHAVQISTTLPNKLRDFWFSSVRPSKFTDNN